MNRFDKINLEKGMYKDGSFTEALESLDPSENYIGTTLEGLDAFERQLKRFNIVVSGRSSDTVEKFFQTSNSAVLFPEYVIRCVKSAMEQHNKVKDIVASTTQIESMDYRPVVSVKKDDDENPLPPLAVNTKENLVKLRKRGRTLMASYEVVRFQRIDLFSVFLKEIGAYIRKAQMADAVNVLANGCATTKSYVDNGLIVMDLIRLFGQFDRFELNTIIASPDAANGLPIQEQTIYKNGQYVLPFGINLIITTAIKEKQILGFDKNCTLEMVETGGINVDYDKLIDRQFERAAITYTAGFSKIFDDSVKAITY